MQTQYKNNSGFSLMELMVVVAIVAMMVSMAIPSQMGKINQQKILESVELVEGYKEVIAKIYYTTGEFPADNEEAGLPEPRKIIGNYLKSMTLKDGAMHLKLGKKSNNNLKQKTLSIRPVYVPDSRNSPISWVCGFDEVPQGMKASGFNKTDVNKSNLPLRCR